MMKLVQFRRFTASQLINYIKQFAFSRVVNQWHVHHTWLPDYSQFNGSNHDVLQEGMKEYHMQNNGWSDIGQHLTLFPDGVFLLGRDLNKTPASVLGWNTGALACEMVGNFDVGHDLMTEAQKLAMYEVSEFLVEQMHLIMRFHRDSPTSYKTCPGSGIDRNNFFDEVACFTENKIAKELQDELQKQALLAAARKKLEEMKKIMEQFRVLFSDMFDNQTLKPHWANDYVNYLADKKVIKGIQNEDGTFRFEPDRPITRAETAAVVAKAMESLEETIAAELKKLTDSLGK